MSKTKKQNKKGFKPSDEWFNNYRFISIDYYILETLYDSIQRKQLLEIEDTLEDSEFLTQNFPSFSIEEIEEFIEYDYLIESTFINNLQIFIKNERKRIDNIQNKFSKQEKKWLKNSQF